MDREYPIFAPDWRWTDDFEFEFKLDGERVESMISADKIFSNGRMLPCGTAFSSGNDVREQNGSVNSSPRAVSRQNSMPARIEHTSIVSCTTCSSRLKDAFSRFRSGSRIIKEQSEYSIAGSRRLLLPKKHAYNDRKSVDSNEQDTKKMFRGYYHRSSDSNNRNRVFPRGEVLMVQSQGRRSRRGNPYEQEPYIVTPVLNMPVVCMGDSFSSRTSKFHSAFDTRSKSKKKL